jgi:predicted ferric reductase
MPSDDPLLHLSRAAGLGALNVLWLDVCLGLVLTSGLKPPWLARWRVADLHQFTSLLGLGLLATHITVLVGLQQQAFTPIEVLVPLARQLNPAAPLMGILAMYSLLLVMLVSFARRLVGLRMWRTVHRLSFGSCALALGHALAAGPDSGVAWIRLMYVAQVLVLVVLATRRARSRQQALNTVRLG